MKALETVLLLIRLSVSMSESDESHGDGHLDSNDTRVNNNTEHEVNIRQLKYSWKTLITVVKNVSKKMLIKMTHHLWEVTTKERKQ